MLVNIGHGVRLDGRTVLGLPRRALLLVVVVVRGLAGARGGGGDGHALVVAEATAASARFDNGGKAAPIFLIKKCIQDRVDAGVGGA